MSLETRHFEKVQAARPGGPVMKEQQCSICTSVKVGGECPKGCDPRQVYVGPRDAEKCASCGRKALVPDGSAKRCTYCGDTTSSE